MASKLCTCDSVHRHLARNLPQSNRFRVTQVRLTLFPTVRPVLRLEQTPFRMSEDDDFLNLITECQGWLFGYILSLLANHDAANEVLQESNLVIWRKHDEFEAGTNFRAWVLRIANFQVMAYRQKRVRELHPLSIDLIERVGARMQERVTNYDEKLDILAKCLEKLPEPSRELITRRYLRGDSIPHIADELSKDRNAIRQILFRIRSKLIECAQLQLRSTDSHA